MAKTALDPTPTRVPLFVGDKNSFVWMTWLNRIRDKVESISPGIGFSYGGMYQGSTGFTVTLTTVNNWYELDAATTNISAGELNQVTFPGDHYLQVGNNGIYKIDWSCTLSINSANQGVSVGVMKNGVIQDAGKGRSYFINSTRNLNISSNAILSLEEGDQISLGSRNITSSGKIITASFINVSLVKVGGF